MEIRLSAYNAPFCEPFQQGVHYISLDDQADMRLGRFDAHVRLFISLKPSSFVVGRPFARPAALQYSQSLDEPDFLAQFNFHNYSEPDLLPFSNISRKSEIDFLDELAQKTKIKAASKRLSKVISFVADKSKPSFIDIYKNSPVKYQPKISKAKQFLNSLSTKNNT